MTKRMTTTDSPLSIPSLLLGAIIAIGIGLSPIVKNSLGSSIIVLLLCSALLLIIKKAKLFKDSNLSKLSKLTSRKPTTRDTQPLRIFLLTCAIYFASCLLSFLFETRSTQHLSDFDLPFRFLLIPSIGLLLYSLMRTTPISLHWLSGSFLLAAGMALGIAIYQKYGQNQYSITGGSSHHILFGGLSAMIAVTCLALPHRWSWLSIVGFLVATAAAFLSTSRGAWPALLLIPALHLFILSKQVSKPFVITVAITSIALFTFLIMTPSTSVKHRLNEAVSNVESYFVEDNHNTNVGLRFEMWKGAWIIFKDHWAIGVGLEEYDEAIEAIIKAGKIRHVGNMHMHPHNDLLNEMATRGFLGAITYMAILLIPFYFFSKKAWLTFNASRRSTHSRSTHKRDDPDELNRRAILGLSLAGVYTVITFSIAGLSEALLTRNLSVNYYLFIITLFYLFIFQSERQISK